MIRIRTGWLLASFVVCATPAFADSITVGSSTGAFVVPFGCGAAGCLGEYQQIYAATAFNGPITINQVAFESWVGSAPNSLSDTFTLGLATTAATPAAPGTSYALNRGSDFTNVFAGTIEDAAVGSGTFDFVINLATPFTYNPSNGNLLLDVHSLSVVVNGPTNLVGFMFGNSPDTGRLYDFFGPPISQPNVGLLTQFTGSAAQTPEPASIALLATGLAVGALRRRRKSVTRSRERGFPR
jgi:PEP-CTERM motif